LEKTVLPGLVGPGLHAPTLLLSIAMFGFIIAGIALGDPSALPAQRRALQLWGRAMLAAGLSCLLFYLRGHAPWWLSFGVANLCFIGLPLYSLLAHAQLLRQPPPRPVATGVLALVFAGIAAHLLLGTTPRVPIVCLSVGFTVLQATTCRMLWRDFALRGAKLSLAGLLIGIPLALSFGTRAVRVLMGQTGVLAPTDASSMQIGVLVIGMLHIVGTSIVFFSMVHASQRDAMLEAFRRDGLTGVYSRHAFFEFATARLRELPALGHAVLMVDLDRFKQINDTFGHAGGDAALTHAARAMGLALRSTDLLGRYGGEEFCVLITDCTPETALQLAERIVQGARRQQVRLPDGRTIGYTLSAGCAMVPAGPEADTALRGALDQADAAMYRAKQGGRDRAVGIVPPVAGAAAA
jgi:diguanylate cyclase (GGDEF)-like protein